LSPEKEILLYHNIAHQMKQGKTTLIVKKHFFSFLLLKPNFCFFLLALLYFDVFTAFGYLICF